MSIETNLFGELQPRPPDFSIYAYIEFETILEHADYDTWVTGFGWVRRDEWAAAKNFLECLEVEVVKYSSSYLGSDEYIYLIPGEDYIEEVVT